MKSLSLKLCLVILLSAFPFYRSSSQNEMNPENLFDFNWRFYRGGAQGAENPAFNDSQWRRIDLPHDWSIEDLPGTNSPFSINAISQVSGGFTTGGTGWYRKTFTVPDIQKDKRFMILFEGIYMNSELYLNGVLLGTHPYGYTSFWFDITDNLMPGKENVLCIKVRNEGENSRWYSGSGIYRHVWLMMVNSLHFETWGTCITTPEITGAEALISVKNTLINQASQDRKIKLITKIFGPDGQLAGQSEISEEIGSGKSIMPDQKIRIAKPVLWSPDSPFLYKAVNEIYESDKLTDQVTTDFGIRSFSYDAMNGFMLNGKVLKIMGGCVHHDNGPLGSMAFDRAEERRVELLKASGFNAIRTSHNPPSPAFLDACDRLGMLVMDEAFDMWNEEKNPADYHLYFNDWWKKDIESMVYRDRNHPSVIMWSIGNEIPNKQKPEVVEVAKKLAMLVRSLDPTRPVTSAVNDLKPDKDPYFACLDVAGYNYASGGDHNQSKLYEQDHIRVPGRVMVGTESFPLEAFSAWMDVIDHPYVIGDFVWTAFDYIGEASIGWRGYWQKQDFFPWNLAFCGDIDICGWKRPQSYYRDALWKQNQLSVWVTPPKPSFELNPDRQSWSKWHWSDAVDSWNWQEGMDKPLEVKVYSSCDQVELFLNGKSLGRKPTNRTTEFMASWQVPYHPGTLRAVGYHGKKQVTLSELKTAGAPVRLKMTADRTAIKADGQDLSYVTVELTDSQGVRNPEAENQVNFEIEGPGKIIATGNANPMSTESFQSNQRKGWRGRCLVIIKSENAKGRITVKASSQGLETGKIEIESK
jgi:beta-galactosidase